MEQLVVALVADQLLVTLAVIAAVALLAGSGPTWIAC